MPIAAFDVRLAVSIYLAIGTCAATAQDNRPSRATFAEMIAYP